MVFPCAACRTDWHSFEFVKVMTDCIVLGSVACVRHQMKQSGQCQAATLVWPYTQAVPIAAPTPVQAAPGALNVAPRVYAKDSSASFCASTAPNSIAKRQRRMPRHRLMTHLLPRCTPSHVSLATTWPPLAKLSCANGAKRQH